MQNFLSLIRSFPEDDIKKYEYFAFSDQDDVVSKTHYVNSINHMKKTVLIYVARQQLILTMMEML